MLELAYYLALGFVLSSKKGMPSAGLELPTFGTKGQLVTTRPLRHVEVNLVNLRVNLQLSLYLSFIHLLSSLNLISILQ